MNNKEFIRQYLKAISGNIKSNDLIEKYVSDPKLKAEVQFYECAFPKYEIIPQQILSEDDRVYVKAKIRAVHLGALQGIPPTFKTIELLMAAEYQIKEDKIIDHWLVFDRLSMMEQLGLVTSSVKTMYA